MPSAAFFVLLPVDMKGSNKGLIMSAPFVGIAGLLLRTSRLENFPKFLLSSFESECVPSAECVSCLPLMMPFQRLSYRCLIVEREHAVVSSFLKRFMKMVRQSAS